jgi:hypothetical protein
MHYQEIIKYYRKIILLILDNKILEALTTLSQLAENEEKQYHTIQIEKL